MARGNKRTSRFGTSRKVIKDKSIDFSSRYGQEEQEEKSGISQLKLGLLILFCLGLLGFGMYIMEEWTKSRIEARRQTEQEQPIDDAISKSEELPQAYQERLLEADSAYAQERYFEAVYHYNQALRYDESNIDLYEKLMSALKQSCESGNEIHCNKEEAISERMEWIKAQSSSRSGMQKDSVTTDNIIK